MSGPFTLSHAGLVAGRSLAHFLVLSTRSLSSRTPTNKWPVFTSWLACPLHFTPQRVRIPPGLTAGPFCQLFYPSHIRTHSAPTLWCRATLPSDGYDADNPPTHSPNDSRIVTRSSQLSSCFENEHHGGLNTSPIRSPLVALLEHIYASWRDRSWR
jgi:hypothetical protein